MVYILILSFFYNIFNHFNQLF